MRSSRLLLVLALLLVVPGAGLGAWLLLRTEASVETASGAEATAAQPAQTPVGLSTPGQEPAQVDGRSSVEIDGAELATFSLENAHWVEVRVVLPIGTPLDEELVVVATADESFAERAVSELVSRAIPAAVASRGGAPAVFEGHPAADGSLRVAFEAEAGTGTLDLRAHYLFLDEPLEVSLPAEGPVTLEPRLGGRLVAVFDLPSRPPAGFELEAMEPAAVRLFGWDMGGGSHQTGSELGPSLALEVGGLRPGLSYFLNAELEDLVDVSEMLPPFEPGQTQERHIQLVAGAILSGRVIDEAGTPVEGAQVSVESEETGTGLFSMSFMGGGGASTEADGTFELRGLPPRGATVTASQSGYLDSELLELQLADGEVLEGLELMLPSGERVTGRVTFPDGRPAAGAQVQLEEKASRDTGRRVFVFDQSHEKTADAEGRFAIGGLGRGPYSLRVEAGVVSDESVGEHVRLHRAERWRARVDDVRAGAEVAVVLEPPIIVRGVAVDDTGAPVTRFRVRAGDASESDVPWRVVESTDDEQTESEDGSFEVRSLGRGTWTLSLEAEGHGDSQERTLTLPGETGPFTFVLPRVGALAGRVLDPSGRPAAAASVALTRSGGVQRWMRERDETEADEQGLFRFEDVAPGAVELVARADEAAPSEALGVEVLAAVPSEGLELTLRLGKTLTGEVYNPDGTVDAGRQVMVQQPISGEGSRGVTTDASGRFHIEHLAPGHYQVAAFPDMDLVQGAEQDAVAMIEQMRMQSAEVRDGEVTHVVLGAPPAEPVALTGVVREADRPADQLMVVAFAEGSSMLSSLKSARTAADGSFAMTLPAPGDWILMVGEELSGEGSEFPITVPAGDGHHVELELPTGRVSGRVIGTDGAPAESIQVALAGGRTISIFNTSGGRETQSDENGRFHFERVQPGAYELRAGADSAAGYFGAEGPGYGIALLSGLVLEEGGALDGLELRLSEPGTIRGLVRSADGSPAAEASVWVRDSAGRVLNTRSWCVTDSGGHFTFRGAGRGSYTVLARSEDAASQEVAVDVSEGLESEVELTLESGTILVVAMEDEEGNALRAVLRVYDGAGREVSGLASEGDMERAMMEGFSTREQRIGPLPAGRYRVEAVAEDGARAAKPVKLSGQAERRLRLRLKD